MLGIARTYQGRRCDGNNVDLATSTFWGQTINASATIHTKGAYEQLVASTAYDWCGWYLLCSNTRLSANQSDQLLDIAIGPAGSEQIILPNWMSGYRQVTGAVPVYVPLAIPRGTRIAARMQARIASDSCQLAIWGLPGNSGLPGPLFTNCDDYGTAAASSNGTSHTPGNSGAESLDANLGAVTSRPYGAVLLGTAPASATLTALGYAWELRIGGNTRGEWNTSTTTGEEQYGPLPPCPMTVSVPTGTQLQLRAQASGTAIAHTAIFYCFY